MFTGIVEELGTVEAVERLPDDAARLRIRGPLVLGGTRPGDSIAVNGVCLTVVDPAPDSFDVDVMAETLRRSAIGSLSLGDRVNLERAMAAGSRFGGHIVQGHVDGTARLLSREQAQHWDVLRFSLPADLRRYLVEKGSITVSGVSLTVVAVGADDAGHWFTVSLIPTTLRETTLGGLQVGDAVNLEVDVIAKYVESLLAGRLS